MVLTNVWLQTAADGLVRADQVNAFTAAGIDLAAPDALDLLGRAPDPTRAQRQARSKISAALKRARRRDPDTRAETIQAVAGEGRCCRDCRVDSGERGHAAGWNRSMTLSQPSEPRTRVLGKRSHRPLRADVEARCGCIPLDFSGCAGPARRGRVAHRTACRRT